MIIDVEKIVIENSNLPHELGALDLHKFKPFPKNPPISKVFREIGLADELGSGMRNTYKFTQLYSGKSPLFVEENIFKTTIPLKKIATQKVGPVSDNVPRSVPLNVPRSVPLKIENKIKNIIKNDIKVSRKNIALIIGVSEKTITRYIKEITDIKYVGKGKNGHWELINQTKIITKC